MFNVTGSLINYFFTTVVTDRRKIDIIDIHSGVKHIHFDNKEYIITENTFKHHQLSTQCETYGPEYKPAYINYNEEYEMWVRNEFENYIW